MCGVRGMKFITGTSSLVVFRSHASFIQVCYTFDHIRILLPIPIAVQHIFDFISIYSFKFALSISSKSYNTEQESPLARLQETYHPWRRITCSRTLGCIGYPLSVQGCTPILFWDTPILSR